MVSFSIQSGPVGTMTIPADPRRLVALFLEDGCKVCVDSFPSAINVDGVGCRRGWSSATSVLGVGSDVAERLWGGSVPVMERRRRRRRPEWSVVMVGWHGIFRQVVVGGMLAKLMAWLVAWVDCGT
jgi:hypothetical protein